MGKTLRVVLVSSLVPLVTGAAPAPAPPPDARPTPTPMRVELPAPSPTPGVGALPTAPPTTAPSVAVAAPVPTAPPVGAPATQPAPTGPPVPEEYALLMTRNVFLRGPPKPAGPPAGGGPEANLGLKGVISEDGSFTAFVEEIAAKRTLRLKAGDPVGAGRVKSISIGSMEYEAGGKSLVIQVGHNLLGMPLPPPAPPTTAPAQQQPPPQGQPVPGQPVPPGVPGGAPPPGIPPGMPVPVRVVK